MKNNNSETIISKTQSVVYKENLCQICNVSVGGYNYVEVRTNRKINSCFECRLQALEWLGKECLVCKVWLFGQKDSLEKTCSPSCEQKLQESLAHERIFYGKHRGYRDN